MVTKKVPIEDLKEPEMSAKTLIVQDSIRSAICIDDTYAAPYRREEDLNSEEPEKLYYSFRKEGKCDLDIYRFQGIDEWEKHKYLVHNKDLLVLDWELDQTAPVKFAGSVKILDYIINSRRTPFVVIYTSTEDLGQVSKTLLSSFNNFNGEDYDTVVELLKVAFKDLSENNEDIELFLEQSEKIFHDYIRSYNNREKIEQELLSSLVTFLEITQENGLKKCGRTLHASLNKFKPIENKEESILLLANIYFSRNIEKRYCENKRIQIDKYCYSINGVIVMITHKEDKFEGVKPENLFSFFSEAITNNPHSIINLIGLELKDKFREDFAVIGTKFNTVDEKAFLYHASNYKDKEYNFDLKSFRNFVVRSWIHELREHNLDLNLRSFNLIEELIKDTVPENPKLYNELGIYAAMVSTVRLSSRINNLAFGDLFKSDEKYFLCITPHCDCLRPSDKINNEFYFLRGEKRELKSALKKGEVGYISFFIEDGLPAAVEWTCKPFTSFISEEMNSSANKVVQFSGINYPIEFLCSIKENYAQRIANQSFGYGFRVGIDLPHL